MNGVIRMKFGMVEKGDQGGRYRAVQTVDNNKTGHSLYVLEELMIMVS